MHICCCDKHYDQKHLGEERVYLAYRLESVHHLEKPRQKPGSRNKSRGHRVLFTGLLPDSWAATFLNTIQDNIPRAGTADINQKSRPTRLKETDNSSTEIPSTQESLVCIKT